MTPHQLLAVLATELWETAELCVADAIAGRPLPARFEPLRPFIVAQPAASAETYHLPEPMLLASDASDHPDVLVIGTNAGVGSLEIMPTLSFGRERYIRFYATRFDDHGRTKTGKPATSDSIPKYNKHYGTTERVLVEAGMGTRPLGRRAVYADAVPWKTRTTARLPFDDPIIQATALERVARIAEALNPRVILLPVMKASRWLADSLGAGDEHSPIARRCSVGAWRGTVIPMIHHARWPTTAHCQEISCLIAAALAQ